MAIQYTPKQKRDLAGIPNLDALPGDRLIQMSFWQISVASTLPLGSVGSMLARQLTPAVPGSHVYKVSDLRDFCARHATATTFRLLGAAAAKPDHIFSDPADAAREFVRKLLDQPKQ